MNRVAAISLPAGMYDSESSAGFVAGIALPDCSSFRSAAVVAGPDPQGGDEPIVMGVVAYNKSTKQYGVTTAPQNADSWPSAQKCSAVCGVRGGFVAFALKEWEGTSAIRIHDSQVSSGSWGLKYAINFGSRIGVRVQCMLERNGTLYGFLKDGAKNYFFSVELPTSAPESSADPMLFPCDDSAAAFFPRPSPRPNPNMESSNQFMLKTIAFCNDRIYAIDETFSKVICASLDGSSVTTLPLAKPDTWGLLIDEKLQKAYCTYVSERGGLGQDVLPYTVRSDALTRGANSIYSGFPLCPALDAKLGLLYLPSGLDQFQVFRTDKDTAVTVTGDSPPDPDNFLDAIIGSWADAEHGIFYASGRLPGQMTEDKLPSRVLVYEVAVTDDQGPSSSRSSTLRSAKRLR
jgi:hypothetical protein